MQLQWWTFPTRATATKVWQMLLFLVKVRPKNKHLNCPTPKRSSPQATVVFGDPSEIPHNNRATRKSMKPSQLCWSITKVKWYDLRKIYHICDNYLKVPDEKNMNQIYVKDLYHRLHALLSNSRERNVLQILIHFDFIAIQCHSEFITHLPDEIYRYPPLLFTKIVHSFFPIWYRYSIFFEI